MLPSVNKSYRSKPNQQASKSSLDDHPYLAVGRPMRLLFEALQMELLALDTNITAEILELFIAHKAKANLVDIVSEASIPRLALSMPFPRVSDPKGVAEDVANLGRWGNGNVEIGLMNEADIPCVLGLVPQALEQQLSNGAAAV